VTFGPGLPEQQRFKLQIPAGLKDDAGRPLENARSFPLTVRTDEYPPLVKFPALFGILEARLPGNEKALLPVTVRNVEPTLDGSLADGTALAAARKDAKAPIPGQVATINTADDLAMLDWLRRVERSDKIDREYDDKRERWVTKRYGAAYSIFGAKDPRTPIAVPKPLGARAFEVVGIPLEKPGFYVVELASPKLGASLLAQNKPYYASSTSSRTGRAFQAWARVVARMGDSAQRRDAGPQCPHQRARLLRQPALARSHRCGRDCAHHEGTAARRFRMSFGVQRLLHRCPHRRRHGVFVFGLG
jgi:hypothetical protein